MGEEENSVKILKNALMKALGKTEKQIDKLILEKKKEQEERERGWGLVWIMAPLMLLIPTVAGRSDFVDFSLSLLRLKTFFLNASAFFLYSSFESAFF